MLSHRLISTATSTVLLLTGIAGGYAGNVLAERNAAALNARENVATMVAQHNIAVDYLAGTQARAILADFASVTDTASALVASSDGKASQDSRNALQAILDEIKVKVAARTETGAEARDIAEQIVATGTPAIEASSKVISDEVAAWEQAEAERIAAEQAAAEAAAQAEREASQRSSGGYSNSNGNNSGGGSSGGSSNGGGGNSGGGGDRAEQWRQIAAGQGINCFSVIPGSTSYYSSGCIQIGQNPLNANAERVLWHEIAHHYTAGLHSYTVACTKLARELGGDIEVWAQAWTQVNLGWSMPQYPAASQSFIDGMRNAGCGI